jgi:hypothetical protein
MGGPKMDARYVYLGIIAAEAVLIVWLLVKNVQLSKQAAAGTTGGMFTQYYGMPYPLCYSRDYGVNRF